MCITVVANGQCEQVNDKYRKCPTDNQIQKHEWKTEQHIGFIENMEKGEVHHDNAHNKEDDPGFTQLQALQNPVTDTEHHEMSLE
jgi:hypothetical protein